MDNTITAREEQLIEKQGAFYERYHNMTPVAARIFSLLLINGRKGTSFDQIVNKVSASKSTVSTNVKNLIEDHKIQFFTERGDRKRYFVVNPVHFISGLNKELVRVSDELAINKEMIAFKQDANMEIEDDNEKYQLIAQPSFYQDYLNESIELLTNFKTELETRVANNKLVTSRSITLSEDKKQ